MVEVVRKELKNGIRVVFEKRNLPVVSLGLANNFGGAHEKSEVKGIAHFIEHLLFTGTINRDHEEIAKEVEKKGGILNGFTDQEMTAFWFKMPSEHLFCGLDILVDIMKNPVFDKKKFEKEKKVIIEEIKMYHDDPKSYVGELLEGNLYDKPFGETIAGSEKVISGLDRDFVVDFYKEMYDASNYFVSIVGDADLDKVCEFLEKAFVGKGKENKIEEIRKKNSEDVEERLGIDQAHFAFGVHAPLFGTKEYYVLQVLDAYLADGMSSKLWQEVREKRGLAYSVNSGVELNKNFAYYRIYIGTQKKNVDEVKKIILDEFAKIEDMGEKDFEEAVERVVGLRKVVTEESVTVMKHLLYCELCGNLEEYGDFETKVRGVNLGDVKRLAKDLLKDGYSTAAIVPRS